MTTANMIAVVLAAAAQSAPAVPVAAPNDYALEQNWLCRPDRRDACSTPSVAVPELYSAQCVTVNGANVLSVRINADPADPRIDDVGGDVRFGAFVAQDWGLHLIDVSLVMQDMVDLAPVQLSAWKARSGG